LSENARRDFYDAHLVYDTRFRMRGVWRQPLFSLQDTLVTGMACESVIAPVYFSLCVQYFQL
jgi:hypothetical protein